MNDFSVPSWKQIGDLYEENNNLLYENALKLAQILGLEQLIYDTRILDEQDGSPCWCCVPSASDGVEVCIKAREATEPFWKR